MSFESIYRRKPLKIFRIDTIISMPFSRNGLDYQFLIVVPIFIPSARSDIIIRIPIIFKGFWNFSLNIKKLKFVFINGDNNLMRSMISVD